MPRVGAASWWLAVALNLLAVLEVRAQIPDNPLRQRVSSRVSARVTDIETESAEAVPSIWDEPADGPLSSISTARAISATQELPPPAPPTIVPQRFGQGATHGYGQSAEPWPGGSAEYDAWADFHSAGLHSTGAHDSRVQPWFTHTDPNDPYRHVGLGRPLVGTSWLNRPWYVGAFLGGLLADDLISNHVETNNSFFLGGRLGWDFDHYWGLEGRYAFSRPQINDARGDTLPDPAREYFIDVSLAYYPWGDSQWRPFATVGLGLQTFRFHDDTGESIHQSLLSVPLGVGLKVFYSPYCTLRLEAYDNIAWGDGALSTMHNFTLAAGAEFRFGGRPTSYFPWHGSTSYW